MGRHKKISSMTNSVIHFKDENGNSKMNITKDVKKKVTNPISGAKVERVAHVTITVPDYTVIETKIPAVAEVKAADGTITTPASGERVQKSVSGLTIANAIATFGSVEKLIQYAIAGLWNHVRTNESNALGQADKATRQLSKAAKALKQVMPSMSDESLRAMLMANPEYAATFQSQTFELEISKTVAIADFDAPVIDPAAADEEETEKETDDEKAE